MPRTPPQIIAAYRAAIADLRVTMRGQWSKRHAAGWRVYDDHVDALIAECNWDADRAIANLPAPYMVAPQA